MTSSARVFPQLPPELTERIVCKLDRNEVAASFRQVNKAAAAQFSGPEHTIIRLSQPVPPHAFAAHWQAPGAMRGLTLSQRRQLICATATTGSVANLEVAVQAAGCLPSYRALQASASAGQLDTCRWLIEHGCLTHPHDRDSYIDGPAVRWADDIAFVAASGGHKHVCDYLKALQDKGWVMGCVIGAARGGHIALMEQMNQQRRPRRRHARSQGVSVSANEAHFTLWAVAHGCDLATLQHFWVSMRPRRGPVDSVHTIMEAAAGSPTEDWAAKVEWLLGELGGDPSNGVWLCTATEACSRPDALARLKWLRERGFPIDSSATVQLACTGNTQALQYVLAELGPAGDGRERVRAIDLEDAARCGHLAALQALHGAGWRLSNRCLVLAAAAGGQLQVLAWLMETLDGPVVQLGTDLFAAAARSGNVALLAWLRERGPAPPAWRNDAYEAAAESGCEEMMEALAQAEPAKPNLPSRTCQAEPAKPGVWGVCLRLLSFALGFSAQAVGQPAGVIGPTGHQTTGRAYVAACVNGDLAMARCLRRLGVPWGHGQAGSTKVFTEAAAKGAPLRMLRWLLEEGCPVDKAQAREAVESWAGRASNRAYRTVEAEVSQVLGLLGPAPAGPRAKKQRTVRKGRKSKRITTL
ncbi:hypothetical protein GPECTOR_116g345 [Gonium pectorale]|uniref:Uncharacterized protein n=1 Tax=Gonium pectorale TaxID=33097 RepID=A0A150FYX4_GONPE|nr:hypothetical protein GPECTOR_116g345 [Gonium pectorale]|eukprot:KXZ42813.1 hypothetical protein GPECTOR_116g345 [Gonium pectorale]